MDRRRLRSFFLILLRVFQGMLIGLGAVLPGVSGGVLSVLFGIYRPAMEFLAHPRKNLRVHFPLLAPTLLGAVMGFVGVSGLLASLLASYPYESVCLFVGLIGGMLPSLYREAGAFGRDRRSYIAMLAAGALVFFMLLALKASAFAITPSFFWYMLCGAALALSILAPGMSFSASLMPLGLYTPFVDGIGHLLLPVIIPGTIGALLTILLLSRLINSLFQHHYSVAYHAIFGIVTAAAVMTVPPGAFLGPTRQALTCLFFLLGGVVAACLLDRFNACFR